MRDDFKSQSEIGFDEDIEEDERFSEIAIDDDFEKSHQSS